VKGRFRALVAHPQVEALGELAEILGSTGLAVETARQFGQRQGRLLGDILGRILGQLQGPAQLAVELHRHRYRRAWLPGNREHNQQCVALHS